jgi:GT2 family glycosyltransferase
VSAVRLSVVVVNWNSREDLAACLESLRLQTHRDLEIVVVDNGSTDGSVELMRNRFPECKLLAERENLGFAEACNRGIDASSGEWVAMLNNDAVADEGWAEALVRAAERCPAHCGMLQSLMLFMHDPSVVNSTGIELLTNGRGRDRLEGSHRTDVSAAVEIFCPTAGAAAYRRTMLDRIRLATGYFDRSHFMYYEDLDLGWRARLAGWSAMLVPDSVVRHKYQASTKRRTRSWLRVVSRTNRARTLAKNASPHLLARSLHHTVWDVAVVAWNGGPRAVASYARALRDALKQRRGVDALVERPRAETEARWVAAEGSTRGGRR